MSSVQLIIVMQSLALMGVSGSSIVRSPDSWELGRGFVSLVLFVERDRKRLGHCLPSREGKRGMELLFFSGAKCDVLEKGNTGMKSFADQALPSVPALCFTALV